MRQSEREIKDRKELEEVIMKAEVCRLAMVEDGEPYIVPMNYGYRDGRLYFHCAREGRKLDILRRNPAVCFEMESEAELVRGERPCQWTTRFTSVVGWGIATVSTDEADVKEGLEALMEHYSPGPHEFEARPLSLTAIIRVDVTRMTGKRSKR